MKRESLAVILVVLVAGSLTAGYLVGNQSAFISGRTSTVTVISTVISTVQVTASCIVSDESTGFFLHLVTDSAQTPVEGVSVTATPAIECEGYTLPDTSLEATYTTNGSGWAVISIPAVNSEYALIYSFSYAGRVYNLTVSWMPQQGTFTTVSLPSGNVTTTYLYPKSCNGTCTF